MIRKWMIAAASLALLVISPFLTGCDGGFYGTTSTPNTPPSGLTATAGNGQVTLAWTAPASTAVPLSYNVYYSTSAGVTTASGAKVAGLTGLTYTLTGLTNGTTYYFIVTAVYSAGESTATSVASATPSAPVQVAALVVTTSSLPGGTVNAGYSTTLAASGGTSPYTWSVTSGSLPAGLTLAASTGIISGTPTGSGTSSFTVQVKDSESTPVTATANLSITINPATLAITSTTLPSGTVNAGYSTTLAASGGTSPYTWSVTSGSLPAGLTLAASTGIISGTPTGSGTSSFTVQVKDSESTPVTATANLSITINPGTLTITSSSLPGGTVNASYSTTLAASGGTSPYTWSVTSGSLPAGLALAASTGIISGTPTGSGTSSFTVQVKDSESTPVAATANLSITINPATLTITSSSLPGGTVNASYSTILAASGGTAPYTWSVTSGSLPAGLTLAASTGIISGTPTGSGTSSFTVQVKDSESTPVTATANLSITINSATLAIASTTLPGGTVNAGYSTTLVASGGTSPYTWSVTSGSLPAGLTLAASTGIISGTPIGSGTSSFTVQVKDSESTPVAATANLSITINPTTLTITSSSLPGGTVNASYSTTLAASGGTSPYTWSVTSGSLPAGLTLAASTGIISGTPIGSGTSSFTVQVKDSESTPVAATANLSITINPATLTITSSSLPGGTVNASYSTTLAASGGTSPYTWSVTSGSLPAGLALAASTGIISGTPTGSGTSSFTVQVKDSESTPVTATANLSITINPATLTITSSSLPGGTVNASYSTTLAASGGTSPYTWSVTSGSLPAGLTLAASTGIISGTPTGSGTSSFTVQVKDSESTPVTATANLSITINPGTLTITSSSLPGGTVNASYSTTLAASGGTAPYTWSVTSGSLPTGLTLAASTGIISGTPTQFQTAVFTVQAQDSSSTPLTGSLSLSISVYSGLEITSTNPSDGYVGQSYSASFTAAGGASPYNWSVVSGSLPPGIALTSSGGLSGTPSAAGTYLFQAQVSDSESTPSILTANFTITILTTNVPSIPASTVNGTVGSPYSSQLHSSGDGTYGTAPFTWQLVSGSLPPGVTLPANGLMTGTPTTAGTYNLIVQVTDANNLTATGPLNITIFPSALTINAVSINPANLGVPYNKSNPFDVTGGTGAFTLSLISGSLPDGLAFNNDELQGTPTEAGAFTFTVQVTDSASNTATKSFTMNVYQNLPCPSGSESELNGTYAFELQGFAGYGLGYPEALAVSFTANGSGGITSAEGDLNISTASGSQAQSYTTASSYSVGASGLGCLTLVNTSGVSQTFAFTLGGLTSGVATRGSIINFDNAGRAAVEEGEFASPGRIVAVLSGTLLKQTTADFALNALGSNFAFGLAGTDNSEGHFGFIGSLANSSSGVFSGVAADSNDNGTVNSQMTGGSGGFTGTPDASGRVLANVTVGGKTYRYVAYIVNADTVFLVSTDAISVNPIAGGTMLATDSSFSDSSLTGNYIYSGSGSDSTNGAGKFQIIGLTNFSGDGSSFSGTSYPYEYECHCGNWSGAATASAGSYTVDSVSGRVALSQSGGGNPPVFYLTGSGSGIAGFLLDTETGAGAPAYEGRLLAQPAETYSTASISGNYGVELDENNTNSDAALAGVVTFANGLGQVTGDATDTAESEGANTTGGAYSVNANGIGLIGITDGNVTLITNGSTLLTLDDTVKGTALLVFEQE